MNVPSINHEQLAAKLLDGTISDGEYRKIEELITSQPEFARNINELVRIEDLLKTLKSSKIAAPPGLFEAVEQSVCSSINANLNSAASSGASIASKSLLGYTAGAIGILVVAGISFWAANSYRQTPPQNSANAIQQNTFQPAPYQKNANTETVGQESTEQSQPSANDHKRQIPPIKAENAASPKPRNNEVKNSAAEDLQRKQFNAEISAPPNSGILMQNINLYLEQYDRAIAANDQISAAQSAQNLGLLYGKLNNMDKARLYFGRSANASHSVGIAASEADAYGQWGMVEMKAGNALAAKEYLNKATLLLEKSNLNADKWKQQLETLKTDK